MEVEASHLNDISSSERAHSSDAFAAFDCHALGEFQRRRVGFERFFGNDDRFEFRAVREQLVGQGGHVLAGKHHRRELLATVEDLVFHGHQRRRKHHFREFRVAESILTDGRQAGRESAFGERGALVECLAGDDGCCCRKNDLAERLAAIEHLDTDFVIGRRAIETIVEPHFLVEIILTRFLFDLCFREVERVCHALRFVTAVITAAHGTDDFDVLAVDRSHHLERRRIFAFRFLDQRLELTCFLGGDHLLSEGKRRNRGKCSDHAAAKKSRNVHSVNN